MGCCMSMCNVYLNRCMYDLCCAKCCVSKEELEQRKKIMRLFNSLNHGAQNCGCLKAEFPDNGEIRANNTMPDDLQSCPVRCCLCLYPFEDQLDKAEVEKFRDDVAAPGGRSKQPMLQDKTAGLFCDLVVGFVDSTKSNLDANVLKKDKGVKPDRNDDLLGPMYPGLPRYTEKTCRQDKKLVGHVNEEELGLAGALKLVDDVEMGCFKNEGVVTKTEFYRIFMQATIVIQCNLFAALEESYNKTFKIHTQQNAEGRHSTLSRN